jgi:hypothetical protein
MLKHLSNIIIDTLIPLAPLLIIKVNFPFMGSYKRERDIKA